MNREPLTESQCRMLDIIRGFIGEFGYPPTFRQVAQRFGCQVGNVQQQVRRMVAKGYLTMEPKQARTLKIVEQ